MKVTTIDAICSTIVNNSDKVLASDPKKRTPFFSWKYFFNFNWCKFKSFLHYKEIISEGEWAFFFNLTIEFVIKDIGSRSYVPCIKYLSKYIMNLIFFSVSRWPYYPLIDKHLDGLTFEKKN